MPRRPKKRARPKKVTPHVWTAGRRTELTLELAREIADRVANCASFKDACQLSGVVEDTGAQWMERGRERAVANSEDSGIYIQFARLVTAAKSRRRTMLKLLIRRAAQGTDKRPGDWRAAQALGAISDPKEFVPQLRVHVVTEHDAALDRIEAAFKDEPDLKERILRAFVGTGTEVDDEPAGEA